MTTTFHTIDRPVQRPLRTALAFVSATNLGVDAEIRGMQRPPVPNYAMRRLVVGVVASVVAVVVSAAAVGLLAGFGGSPAVASGASPATADGVVVASVHVAQPGDTLWSIANTYRGSIDRNDYIDALVRLNSGTGVQSGQAIWLP